MPHIEVRLLGPLDVEVAGERLAMRRNKQRRLLAVLALRAGEVVSTDRLVGDVWGESPPSAAVGSLHNLVSELRKLLTPEVLVTRPPGYILEVEREAVDAHRFERLVNEAREAADAAARVTLLQAALSLWRGPALADVGLEGFVAGEAGRLEELRAVAREDQLEAELELGRHSQVIGELELLSAENPLRERPTSLLMLALYRAGRQADALDVYRRARENLVDELGIDPWPELQRLEQAILRQDPALAPPHEQTRPRPAAPVPREQDRRKTVTILFADVVDSSVLAAELDPEVMGAVMRRYFEAAQEAVERHGGTVEKFIGDAVMAVFGVPTQHEDDALRAVRAATELRDALAELNGELERDRGVSLEVRMGVNTGEVLAADHGSGQAFATGSTVTVAMRIEQAAQPGEILLGDATYRLVRHAADAEPVGPTDLGGGVGRIPAFRVLGVGEAARPLGGATLVGRADQFAWLRAALAGVQAERRSRVVTVLADAGVGKTRLAAELLSTLGDDAMGLVGRCVSYGEGATYLPLAAIFRQAFPTRPEQAIKALLAGDENAGLLAQRVSQLSGQGGSSGSTGELFWAVRRVFEALALERPLVVVLEDVHWAEPTLLDLVEYLDSWTVPAPLLVVCLARPELVEERPGWGSPSSILSLEPLGQADAEALVGELAGELDPAARVRIVQAAEGNPLFLEQLLAFADEAGLGVLEAVPPTVDALLASRLERLDPEDRALLERAAVAGREFPWAAVVQLSPPEELAAIDGRLTKLIRRGFVSAARDPDDEILRFYHPLVREVAYAAITKEARADLHARYGGWLERREENAEEIVGYHLEQAYRYRAELRPSDPALRALAKGAGDRLSTAGIRAWKHADLSATINLLGRAAALIPPDDRGRAEMLCELGIARQWGGDSGGGEAALSEALAVALDAGDRRTELRARIELARDALLTDRAADPTSLLRLINDAVPVFEESGDDRALGRAWRHAGYVSGAFQGRCAEWIAAEERAFIHYKRSGWSPAGCLSELGSALLQGPTPVPVAVERCERLLDEATDRTGTANVLVSLAGLHALAERFDDGFNALDAGEAIYRELDELYALADNSGRIRGRMHLLAGDPEVAERVFLGCCETFARFGNDAALSTVGSELGQALVAQSRFADAWEWARRAEDSAPAGDIIAQFSWRSLKAKLLAHDGLVADAQPIVAEALTIVEKTDTLTYHGDVLVDAAHVLRFDSRPAEAARRLEQALELFDRKANLASARAARSLLAELIAV